MKKKVVLLACDFCNSDFKRKAVEKLRQAGYAVIADVSTESLDSYLDAQCIIVAHIQILDSSLERVTLRAILAIAKKYGIPLFGVKSNEWELSSERFWEEERIPMLYRDDFELPFVTAQGLRREIEKCCRDDEEVVMAGYSSDALH